MQLTVLNNEKRSPKGSNHSHLIQPKLKISSPGDEYEQDADAMADRVMRMSSKDPAFRFSETITPSIQRKCKHCEEEEKKKTRKQVMRKTSDGAQLSASDSFSSELANSHDRGMPLPLHTRNFMENAFSTDFSDIRIHTGRYAETMSNEIHAKAFTYGKNIYFNSGQFYPENDEGKRLLAHELTHTVQQNSGLIKRFYDYDYYKSLIKDPALKLILDFTSSWTGDLDETALGRKLFMLAWESEEHYSFVSEVFSKLDSDDEDEVGEAFLIQANTIKNLQTEEPYINDIASTTAGYSLLEQIYYGVATGHISDGEEVAAKIALVAFMKQLPITEIAQGIEKAPILPFRPGGITVWDDAPIMANRLADGNIQVHIPQRVQGTEMFRQEVSTLDPHIFYTNGIVFNPKEIVGVKDYTTDESVLYMPAMGLILYSAKDDTMVINRIINLSTLIIGGGAGKAVTWVGKALIFLDRAAIAISAISLVANEHRPWILKTFPKYGKKILSVIDTANTIAGLYGIGRLATGVGYATIKRLRARRQLLAEEAASLGLANEDRLAELEKQMDEIINNVEDARTKLVEEHGTPKLENKSYTEVENLAKANDQEAAAELVKRENKYSEWENALDEPSKDFLDEHPEITKEYQEMPDELRDSLSPQEPDVLPADPGAPGMPPGFNSKGQLPRYGKRTVLKQPPGPTCGPTACGMVINDAGKPVNLTELAKEAGENGTPLNTMMDILKRNKIKGEIKVGATLADLKKATAKGEPAIAIIETNNPLEPLHAVIVDGLTVRNGQAVVAIRNPWGIQYFQTLAEFKFNGQAIFIHYSY